MDTAVVIAVNMQFRSCFYQEKLGRLLPGFTVLDVQQDHDTNYRKLAL